MRTNAGLVARLLGFPLRWKLIGANLALVVAATIAVLWARQLNATLGILAVTLVATMAANYYLVKLALTPLRDLEDTATRVWRGDLDARVTPSPLADRDMLRIGGTLNLLLDGLLADRARLRRLASQVISAQDAERARIARELHDSTAQTLAAAMYQLSAVARQTHDPGIAARLAELRQLVEDAMEEVRTLSHTIHPRVLEDLGLVPALEWLARQTREHGRGSATASMGASDEARGLDIAVESRVDADAVPREAATVLYRVAQESLRNVLQHADAHRVRLVLDADGEHLRLSVIDDGRGFDLEHAEARRPGMGLFSIRERVALVNGSVDIQSAPGQGSTIVASVPLAAARAL